MLEDEMEDLLWQYPEALLKEQLTPFRRQHRSAIGRSDLIFTDRFGNLIIIEIKLGTLKRGAAIDQLLDYYGTIKLEFPDKAVELMVVANHIPEERKLACGRHSIEPREISERRFREVAADVGYVFISESPSSPEEIVPGRLKAQKPILITAPDTDLDAGRADDTANDTEAKEVVDIHYWEQRSSPEAIALFERFRNMVAERSVLLKWSFRKDGIAFGGNWNFARMIPQKAGHCLVRFYNPFYRRISKEFLKDGREKLAQAGVLVQEISHQRCSLSFESKTLDRSGEILVDLIRRAVNIQA